MVFIKYLWIDTNMFIDCSFLTREDHTPDTLKELKNILQGENVILLMPEVTKLEYFKVLEENYKKYQSRTDSFINELNEIYPDINNNGYLLEEDKKEIRKTIKKLLKKRTESKIASRNIFNEIIEFDNVKEIELNNNIFLNSIKRKIKGLKPTGNTNYICQDSLQIETLIYYFNKNSIINNAELIICSNDTNAFADNDREKLNAEIKKSFSINTRYYRKLYDLLKDEFEKEIDSEEIENLEKIGQNKSNTLKNRFGKLLKEMRFKPDSQVEYLEELSNYQLKQIYNSINKLKKYDNDLFDKKNKLFNEYDLKELNNTIRKLSYFRSDSGMNQIEMLSEKQLQLLANIIENILDENK